MRPSGSRPRLFQNRKRKQRVDDFPGISGSAPAIRHVDETRCARPVVRSATMRKTILFSLLPFLFTGAAFAQPEPPPAAPAKRAPAALPPERLARIDHLLQQYVDQNKIAGAVALVLRDGKT